MNDLFFIMVLFFYLSMGIIAFVVAGIVISVERYLARKRAKRQAEAEAETIIRFINK